MVVFSALMSLSWQTVEVQTTFLSPRLWECPVSIKVSSGKPSPTSPPTPGWAGVSFHGSQHLTHGCLEKFPTSDAGRQ